MNLKILFRKFVEFIKSIIVIAEIKSFSKAIKVFIFNAIFNIYPIPKKDEIIATKMHTKMYLIPYDSGISKELKIFKIHEPLTTKILIRELKRMKNTESRVVVVDIGSNIGYYSILEAKVLGKKGIVISIEPVKRNFRYLLKNIKINRIKNVKTINIALSDRNGLAKMIISHGSNWAAILNGNHSNLYPIENVRVKTGDKLFKSFTKIDLIRMDVEGHEYHVIKGLLKVIKKNTPDLLIEIHPRLLGKEKTIKLLSLLGRLGYRTKYFIMRNIDVLLASHSNDIGVIDLNKLILYPPKWTFTIYLEHSSKTNR